MSTRVTPPRLASLDSLRGIAASAVVIYHCWLASDLPQRLESMHAPSFWTVLSAEKLLLRCLAAFCGMGRAAVMMFFVLSGFVLARSLLHRPTPYGGFVVKRLLRIYPAYLVVMVVSYALELTLGTPHPGRTVLMARLAAADLSPSALLKALALWGTEQTVNLDLVTWSLVHELRISLIFPLIYWSLRAPRVPLLSAYAVLSLTCTSWLYWTTGRVAYGFVEQSLLQTWVVTGYFLLFFACGAWLAREFEQISDRLRRLSGHARTALLALAGLALIKGDRGAEAVTTPFVDYAHGAASLLVIALVLTTPRFGLALSQTGLRWLGRVSYGLYLVHLPVLYVLAQTLRLTNPVLMTGAVISVSLALAEVLARCVEIPGIRLGRWLIERRDGRVAARRSLMR